MAPAIWSAPSTRSNNQRPSVQPESRLKTGDNSPPLALLRSIRIVKERGT